MREKLFGKTLAELGEVASALGMPRHAAGQIAAWLYKKGARDIAAMTDISAANRACLAGLYDIGLTPPLKETVSADGTKKYLFAAVDNFVEAAMIPGRNAAGGLKEREENESAQRATLCLSSQAGCRMGCAFCATGRQGLAANLSTGDILNQFASLPEHNELTNIVYMGMGEPLDNLDAVLRSLEILTAPWGYGWSPTRITLSTAGVAPALERFLAESRVHLAVSLHNPFADERAAIMPIERAYPIAQIVDTLRRYPLEAQRRISFEYIVMAGLNDSPRHVAGLVKLLGELSCRVNLIKFHKIPGSPFFSPPPAEIERMRDTLTRRGIRTTIRASRGEDIEAACGLLSTKGAC
ncbi:MAG: 23S rRNA (adenine(2503)-C(2))-methyltransferase RlmN [Alistipes sp.]|jgi:23S rRNA (adenine2503-C2)-methyltransferase|nr:23S rRNA (adenine(2503)-C(2))-methyltransferase RlmN [Alistipes sp.]